MVDRLPTKQHLERLVTAHATDTGIAVARLRRWISTMVLLGALTRVRAHDDGHRFVVKGGVAMELRLGASARVTNDVDATFYGDVAELEHELMRAFAEPISGFTFLAAAPMPIGTTGAHRMTVRLAYQGKSWATVDIEVSCAEPPADLELVSAIDIEHFGLAGPAHVAALSVRYQIAQKLHAVSERFEIGENKRVRDVIDILMLRELAPSLTQVNAACVDLFEQRAAHPWPPTITVYPGWQAEHERLCRLIGFDMPGVIDAVDEVQRYIAEIDANEAR